MTRIKNLPGEAIGVIALLLLAAALRLWNLGGESLWFDELVSYQLLGHASLSAFIAQLRAYDPPMLPGYFVLEWLWAKWFGISPLNLRLLSVLFSLGTGITLYVVARRIAGSFAAAATLALYACSTFHIYYSQEIRNYSFTSFTVCLSMYFFLRLLERPTMMRAGLAAGIGLLPITGHLFSVFVPLAQAPLLILRSRRLPVLAVWGGIYAAAAAMWLWWFLKIDFSSLDVAAAWIAPPGLLGLLRTSLWPGVYLPNWPHMLSVAVLVTGFCLYSVVVSARDSDPARRPWFKLALLILWIGVPVGALWIGSYLRQPMLLERYVQHCSLPLLILIAWGAAALPPMPRLAAAVLIAAACVLQIADRSVPFRCDYREIAAWLDVAAPPGTLPVVHPEIVQYGELSYHLGPDRVALTTVASEADLPDAAAAIARKSGGPVAVIVNFPLGLLTQYRLTEAGLRESAVRDFYAWNRRRVYIYAPDEVGPP